MFAKLRLNPNIIPHLSVKILLDDIDEFIVESRNRVSIAIDEDLLPIANRPYLLLPHHNLPTVVISVLLEIPDSLAHLGYFLTSFRLLVKDMAGPFDRDIRWLLLNQSPLNIESLVASWAEVEWKHSEAWGLLKAVTLRTVAVVEMAVVVEGRRLIRSVENALRRA